MFKTELHLHTGPVSRCARETPREAVDIYLDAGYSTVVVTNHYRNYHMEDSSVPFEKRADAFFSAVPERRQSATDFRIFGHFRKKETKHDI